MTKHVSVSCCNYGADWILTDSSTGTVKAVQWTWDQVQAFIEEHGQDVTTTMRAVVGDHVRPSVPKVTETSQVGTKEEG